MLKAASNALLDLFILFFIIFGFFAEKPRLFVLGVCLYVAVPVIKSVTDDKK